MKTSTLVDAAINLNFEVLVLFTQKGVNEHHTRKQSIVNANRRKLMRGER